MTKRKKKCLKAVALILVLLVAASAGWVRWRMQGPHHDYELDLLLPPATANAEPGTLHVGVAQRSIDPPDTMYDTYTDKNNNAAFDEGVDEYEDRNGNGKFDPLWVAGFNPGRPATGSHDPLTARAIALRNNGVTLVIVALDAIGIEHNDVVTLRKSIDPARDIDHVTVSCTHTHASPDTCGIYCAPMPLVSYDSAYVEYMLPQVKAAIEEAVDNLEPADMQYVRTKVPEEGYVRDSRPPEILDPYLYAFRFTRPGTDDTIATCVSWGNHPEALGPGNTLLTSDYVHWLRKGIEEGVPEPNGTPGFGGMCIFLQGMLGGLMTQLEMAVPHRDGEWVFETDSFDKAQALGENVAVLAANALRSRDIRENEEPLLAVSARTFTGPLHGYFRLAIMLGLLHRGYYSGGLAKTEINAIRLGEVLMLVTPGEIYPEIVEGGVEAKPERDYAIGPIEDPPLRAVMGGEMNLVLGVANDFIGYLLPKTQWDAKPPYIYGKRLYGEDMSAGPEVGPAVYAEAKSQIERLQEAHPFGK